MPENRKYKFIDGGMFDSNELSINGSRYKFIPDNVYDESLFTKHFPSRFEIVKDIVEDVPTIDNVEENLGDEGAGDENLSGDIKTDEDETQDEIKTDEESSGDSQQEDINEKIEAGELTDFEDLEAVEFEENSAVDKSPVLDVVEKIVSKPVVAKPAEKKVESKSNAKTPAKNNKRKGK